MLTLRAMIERCLRTDQRFPSQVFSCLPMTFYALAFEDLISSDFHPIADHLAALYGDSSIAALSVEPSAEDYRGWHGFYGAFSLKIPAELDNYVKHLAFNLGETRIVAHQLVFTSLVFCLAGSSGRWACWGERDHGVAILGVPTGTPGLDVFEDLMTATDALEAFVAFMHGGKVSSDFADEFIISYG
jgi:hypothetical protein